MITHILVLRKRGITLSLSKRNSERIPGLQGRKIAPFGRLRMRFCSLWHLWAITSQSQGWRGWKRGCGDGRARQAWRARSAAPAASLWRPLCAQRVFDRGGGMNERRIEHRHCNITLPDQQPNLGTPQYDSLRPIVNETVDGPQVLRF